MSRDISTCTLVPLAMYFANPIIPAGFLKYFSTSNFIFIFETYTKKYTCAADRYILNIYKIYIKKKSVQEVYERCKEKYPDKK